MKVRTRVVSGLFIAIASLCAALVVLVQTVVVHSFQKLELQRFERNVERVQNALATQLEVLHKKVVDWGQWDDTFHFMKSRNPTYVEENLNFMTLSTLGFRDVLYLSTKGELIQSAHVVAAENKVEKTPNDTAAALKKIMDRDLEEKKRDGSGLAQINGETVLYAFTEVLPSKRDSAGRGMLMITSLVTNSLFKDWSYQTNLDLRFWRFSQETPSSQASLALTRLSKGEKFVHMASDDGNSQVFGIIRDFAEKPAILFEFTDDNVVTHLAERVRNMAVLGVALAGLFVLLFMWWLIDRQILTRLSTLSGTVQQIAATGDSLLRLRDPSSYRRSLLLRVLSTVSASFILMGAFLWAVFETTLTNAFREIETKNLTDNVTRAERALHARTQELLGKTADWAQWDATYDFVVSRDKDYIDTNLNYETLQALRIKAVAYFSQDGGVVFGQEVNSQLASIGPLSDELAQILRAGIPSIRTGSSIALEAGLLRGPDGVIMVTRSPILDSERSKPSRGSFVFVMSVDQALIDDVSRQTRLTVGILPIDPASSTFKNLEVIDDQNIIGRGILTGVDGKHQAIIQVTLRRYIHIQGLAARKTLLLSLALLSLAATFLAALVVHRVIISALRSSIEEIRSISLTGDTTQRVSVTGNDELGVLAEQINSMLDTLARTQHELQKARDEAEAANQAKSTFIAKVSHELRTPIHGVVGMLRILMKEETSKTKRSYIGMAKNSAFSLLDTINEILDFSKMETGNLSLEAIEFQLRDVVRESLRTVAPRAEEKGNVELVCDVMPGVPDRFCGDPLRLKQCLINLLGNSIKFTQQGFVKLTVQSGGYEGEHHKLLISVADSGVGIPAERLPRIFDPFTQADDSVARVFTGTGLGLTIVKQLVEQMRGGVEVTSEVGKGTVFTLTVLLPEVADSTWREPELALSPRRAAIVDGDSFAVKTMHETFERYGIDSIVVNSAEPSQLQDLTARLNEFGLLVVTAEAIKRSHVFNLVVDVATRQLLPLTVIVPPYDISLRERLTALGVLHVLMRPISLEDVLFVVAGQLQIDEESWSNDDEATLVASRALRVLIADDAETNRIILSSMLEEAGHHVTCVENGLDLLASLEAQIKGGSSPSEFDIVLTDIQMPLMDGISVTRRIREIEQASGHGSHIPVIAVTAHAMTDETDKMRACGVDDVVTKPIQPAELARVLTTYGGAVWQAGEAPARADHAHDLSAHDESEVSPEVAHLQDTALRVWKQLRAEASMADFEILDDEVSFTQIFDIADVFVRSGESVRRTMLILKAFDSSFKAPLADLTRAKAERDLGELKSAAHALKGLLLDVGAVTSGKLASTVESFCKDDKFDEAAALVTSLANQVLSIAGVVGKICESTHSPGAEAKRTSPTDALA
jgi:signal transduction histidine kinase/DNA-binding response OmpR family regulator/HPt (histidine-containing phosphotransfer) domain-containing protein